MSDRLTAAVRRLAAVVVGALVLALASASPAAAVDPGAVKLDRKTGCPLFYFPTQPQSAPSPLLFPQHGEHCFQMGAPSVLPLQRFFPSPTPGGSGGCQGSLLVVEAIPKGTDDYVILPFSDIGLGTQILRPPGAQSIPIFNGADTYRAPRGSRVWGLGGGSNGGPCQPWNTHVFNPEAFGVTFKYKISGTLTVAGSRAHAPNITVHAACPGGGNTTTDKNGNYEYLVDSHTTCTVAPRLKNGLKSKPTQRVVRVHRSDVNHVNFQVPCRALAGTASDVAQAASSSGSCPLDVTIVPETRKLTTGIDHVGHFDCQTGDGCVNLTVTVTDPVHHIKVPNADVTVLLGHTSGFVARYPAGTGPSAAHVCTYLEYRGGCSDRMLDQGSLTLLSPDLKTDSNGQVRVQYWAPGLERPGAVTIGASATADICTTTCEQQSGTAKKPAHLHIDTRELGAERTGLLDFGSTLGLIDYVAPIDWAKFGKGLTLSKLWDKAQDIALTYLVGEEVAAAAGNPLVGAAFAIRDVASSAALAARKVFAVILQPLHLADTGLGAGAGNFATDAFIAAFVGSATSDGMIARLAHKLEGALKRDELGGGVRLHLRLFDVSYCETKHWCTGQYPAHNPVNSGNVGIRAFVDFQFTVDRRIAGVHRMVSYAPIFNEDLVEPYNPRYFDPANHVGGG